MCYKIQERAGNCAALFLFILFSFIVDHYLLLSCAVLFYLHRSFLFAPFFSIRSTVAVPFILVELIWGGNVVSPDASRIMI